MTSHFGTDGGSGDERSAARDRPTERPRSNPDGTDDPDASRLCATVVEYEDGPDRCTIHPVDVTRSERLTTWLTADHDAFRSLSALR